MKRFQHLDPLVKFSILSTGGSPISEAVDINFSGRVPSDLTVPPYSLLQACLIRNTVAFRGRDLHRSTFLEWKLPERPA